MSYAEELMDKFKKEGVVTDAEDSTQEQPQEPETPPEAAEDTPREETAQEPPETAKDEPEEKPEEKPEEPKPEEKPEEPKPEQQKPDLSTLTKEEKAQHAFKRQLAKQASKYEGIIAEMNGKFDKVTSELEEIKKAKAEAEKKPLTRDQFEYDDDFVKALVKEGMDEALAKKAAEDAQKAADAKKAAEEQQAMLEAQQRTADTFNANCREAFNDADYAVFEKALRKAADNGLAELLDKAPAVREYIFEQKDGPIVLNEMLSDKASFVRVMSQAGNPMAAYITMHDLAQEVAARPKAAQDNAGETQEQPKPKSTMPSIGKPGANPRSASAGDMWSSDDALIEFVRKHK